MCKQYDTSKTGFISQEEYKSICEELEIQFTGMCKKYIFLLFYSNSFDVEKIPYKQFIEAYGVQDVNDFEEEGEEYIEEDDLDEEERASVVRKCLKIIANALRGKAPVDVFKAQGN